MMIAGGGQWHTDVKILGEVELNSCILFYGFLEREGSPKRVG